MEQKKLLWIIFSATLFLLVVVGAGIIWLYPQPEEQPVAAAEGTDAREAGAEFDPVEWVRSDQKSPGLEERPEKEEDENFVVVYGESDQKDQTQPIIKPEEADSAKKMGESKSDELTDQSTKAQKSTSATQPKPASAEKPKPRPSMKPKTQQTETTRTVRTTEFWIQTGSYTSRTRADNIKAELDRLGFTGRIMSKDVDGTLYYRVRIGPYEKKEEAQKFLTWVKAKEQFSNSYISQVYRNKTIAQ